MLLGFRWGGGHTPGSHTCWLQAFGSLCYLDSNLQFPPSAQSIPFGLVGLITTSNNKKAGLPQADCLSILYVSEHVKDKILSHQRERSQEAQTNHEPLGSISALCAWLSLSRTHKTTSPSKQPSCQFVVWCETAQVQDWCCQCFTSLAISAWSSQKSHSFSCTHQLDALTGNALRKAEDAAKA